MIVLIGCCWRRLCLSISLFLLVVFSSFSWANEKGVVWQPKKDFSADLVEYNKHHPELQKKVFIQIGKAGMRVTGFDLYSGKPSFITIQNFRSHQQWLVKPQRFYYSELPQEDSGTKKGGEVNLSKGVLSSEPCLGMNKEKMRIYEFDGGALVVWSCRSHDGRAFVQHYSKLLGIVVRQEESDGHVFELRNIVLMPLKPEVFKPSSLWREVTLEAFFTGASVLPDYKE